MTPAKPQISVSELVIQKNHYIEISTNSKIRKFLVFF